jgi:hypothetical protein
MGLFANVSRQLDTSSSCAPTALHPPELADLDEVLVHFIGDRFVDRAKQTLLVFNDAQPVQGSDPFRHGGFMAEAAARPAATEPDPDPAVAPDRPDPPRPGVAG